MGDGIADRLARLERDLLRWKGLTLALVAVAAALGAARGTPGRQEAREFVVVGPDGRARAILGSDEGGRPGLEVLDAAGRPRLDLRLAADGRAYLDVIDRGGVPRLKAAERKDGGADVRCFDAAGAESASFPVRSAPR